MKAFLATSVFLFSSMVSAHNIETDQCDVDLDLGIEITKKHIEFSDNKQPVYKIIDNEILLVNDKQVSLTASQQALVKQYSKEIRAVVPQVKDIAVEAVDLAAEGIGIAFTELLGENNGLTDELVAELDAIKVEIETRFNEGERLYIDDNGIEGDVFDPEFEQRIEKAVETTVEQSIGKIMIALGTQMIASGGDSEAFETRMEKFGEQIEKDMEARAEIIEQKADQLCISVKKIDALESEMLDAIPELNNQDVFKVEYKGSKKKMM
ncbi:DUF2884 family protein [Thalassotalea agarivorans]|uniref:DUF2884 family protein n=1 Tax=Thalassotalea agarivorans TaxID=349064 RepID=A0A1H9YM67_THASX|nr:DUF2884 family protein [Thalassotalea agarivorans]SES70052.1 Protein of unknown function [Thalassotalea agarivorans]